MAPCTKYQVVPKTKAGDKSIIKDKRVEQEQAIQISNITNNTSQQLRPLAVGSWKAADFGPRVL
jgi:hypothetical protein